MASDVNKMIRLYVDMAEREKDPVMKLKAGQLAMAFMQMKRPRKKRSDAGLTDEVKEGVSQIEKLLG